LIPHGGHQFALAMAAGLGLGGNESYRGEFQPFGGFDDGTPVRDGRVTPSAAARRRRRHPLESLTRIRE
jgi:hypothetical protein